MAIFLFDLFGIASIGVYCKATDRMVIVPSQVPENKTQRLEEKGYNNSLNIKITEPPYMVMKINYDYLEDTPNKGDLIEIYGVIKNKNHITAEKILLTPQWKHNLIYLRSIPAIPFALYIFFKKWKFNKNTLQFEKRKKNA